jgi:hypothetical protein
MKKTLIKGNRMTNSKDNFVKTIFDFGWKSNINS